MSPATNHQDDIDIPHSDMRRHDAVPIRQYANKLPAKRAKRASPGATIVSELCCSLFAVAVCSRRLPKAKYIGGKSVLF